VTGLNNSTPDTTVDTDVEIVCCVVDVGIVSENGTDVVYDWENGRRLRSLHQGRQ